MYVLITTAIRSMMTVPASLMYESRLVTVQVIEMHTTSAISTLTAGSVANLKQISIDGGGIKD